MTEACQRPSRSETCAEMTLVKVKEQRSQSLGEGTTSNSATTHAATVISNAERSTGFSNEARLFLELAVPGTLLRLGGHAGPLLIASVVGRKFGEAHLAAFTLANLTGNLFSYALMWGVFSAADTLGPQAFGKRRFEDVGLIALRGILVSSSITLVINAVLFFKLDNFLSVTMGQPPESSLLAQEWYRIFMLALPFVVIFNAAWKFLSAQHVMMPLIYVSIFSCVVVLPVALKVLTDRSGFLGSAWAYVLCQATQCCLLLAYLAWKRPHTEGTFPRIGLVGTWKKALAPGPLWEFVSLGGGGMLAQSEWIYWEALGLIIGRLGVLQLGAHTVPNQLLMVGAMAPFAFGTALAIRMGITLSSSAIDGSSSLDVVKKTKAMATSTAIVSVALFGAVTILMYIYEDLICSFFLSSPEVLDMLDKIWWKVCAFNFNLSVFAMFVGVATGLGQQWTLGVINFFFLWVIGIPATYHWTITLGGGLDAAWTCINIPYLLINLSLLGIFLRTNWHKVQDKILAGEFDQDPEVEKRPSTTQQNTEMTALLSEVSDSHAGYTSDDQV